MLDRKTQTSKVVRIGAEEAREIPVKNDAAAEFALDVLFTNAIGSAMMVAFQGNLSSAECKALVEKLGHIPATMVANSSPSTESCCLIGPNWGPVTLYNVGNAAALAQIQIRQVRGESY